MRSSLRSTLAGVIVLVTVLAGGTAAAAAPAGDRFAVAGNTALGMTVGGSGNCASGGTTYFSSAARAMTQYAVSVY